MNGSSFWVAGLSREIPLMSDYDSRYLEACTSWSLDCEQNHLLQRQVSHMLWFKYMHLIMKLKHQCGGIKREGQAVGMAYWVKVSATKPDDLTSPWDLHSVRREPTPTQCPLTSSCPHARAGAPVNTINDLTKEVPGRCSLLCPLP